MPQARPTAASRKLLEQYHFLAENLRDLEEDLRWGLEDSDRIPQEWHRIAQTPGVPFKKALTLRLDVDVVAFFKAMGRGHLTRMNDVLRAFMQARLAGVVKGPEDVDYKPTPLETYLVDTAELIQHMSRRNARRATGRNVVADDMETDRRRIRLRQLEDTGEIPAEWLVNFAILDGGPNTDPREAQS